MKPQTFTWKKLTADELTRVYLDEMRRDFPPSELKPLSKKGVVINVRIK